MQGRGMRCLQVGGFDSGTWQKFIFQGFFNLFQTTLVGGFCLLSSDRGADGSV